MTDEQSLLAAVAAAPDDDLPRLVFADWLDENGQPDRAEFVRAQVRLAASDPWEPFAVLCRHRRPEWVHGDQWWGTLPKVDGWAVEWHPDRAFRRGFGWALLVRDMRWLLEIGPRLFAEAPVGELHLPAATRDEWQAFGRAEWLPRVKVVHFYGTSTPVEPVRELIASPLASGIEEIVFESASGAGMPVILEDTLLSPFGRRLRRLELRIGPNDPGQLYQILWEVADLPQLRNLSLTTFSPPARGMEWLYISSLFGGLDGLDLVNIPAAEPSWHWLSAGSLLSRMKRLRVNGCGNTYGDEFHGTPSGLQLLDLSRNSLDWRSMARKSHRSLVSGVPHLKSLSLRNTLFQNVMVPIWLTHTAFWPNLVELDLRDNRITDAGAEHLLAAPVPPELTAVLLAGNPLSEGMWARLRDHFGDRLIPPRDDG